MKGWEYFKNDQIDQETLFTSDCSEKTNVKTGDLSLISWNDIFNISSLDNYETMFKIWRDGKTLKKLSNWPGYPLT